MKAALIIGVLLIVLGVISLVYQGISYTKREKVLDIGPIHATAEHQKTVPIPPIIGVVLLAGGVVLVIAGTRKS